MKGFVFCPFPRFSIAPLKRHKNTFMCPQYIYSHACQIRAEAQGKQGNWSECGDGNKILAKGDHPPIAAAIPNLIAEIFVVKRERRREGGN